MVTLLIALYLTLSLFAISDQYRLAVGRI